VAATLTASADAARIVGTSGADVLRGRSGPDRLEGLAGNDFLDGGPGRDRIIAGSGNDRVKAEDGARDTVSCGQGDDVVTADLIDVVAADCEVVPRRISRDPYGNPESQHETEVEPDSFASGTTVVATFQVGRIFFGGAANTGFATSRDAGRTWRSGLLPGLTPNSRPPGSFEVASDPVVAFDARHRAWLISSLLVSANVGALVISRSADGLRWSEPVTAVIAPTPRLNDLQLDKQWLACDNSTSSPFFGSCYLSYSDFRTNRMSTQSSRDGGLTWSAPVGSSDNAGRRSIIGFFAPAPQPLVRPNGDVVIPFFDDDRIAAVRSTDGGLTFSNAVSVAPAAYRPQFNFRAAPLPSAEIAGDGTIYVAWADCGLQPGCASNDIVVSRSSDGLVWTPKARVPIDGAAAPLDHELPGLAVDPAGAGATTRLALGYYTFSAGRIDAGFVSSSDAGTTWSRPRRLSVESMALTWLPDTVSGRMLGDYISTSFVGSRAVAVLPLAARPDRRFHQAMFATAFAVPGP
jgi:hypothetical protein